MVGYDNDALVQKADGRYRLVKLVQRRMRELQHGLPPLVESRGTLLATAVDELRQGKIWLVSGEEAARLHEERAGEIQEPPAPEGTPAEPKLPSPPGTAAT
jgi:DNA-directed RNA polymerase subunit K/omega